MAVDTQLANISNVMVYSAMAAYSCALVSYAVDLSGRGGTRTTERAQDRALAGVGAAGIDAHPPATAAASEPVPEPGAHKAAGIGTALTWLALLLHLASVVARGASAQRVPWGNMYEFAVTGSLVVTAVYLGLVVWRRDLRWLGVFAVGPVLLTVGVAVTLLYTESAQLVPALQSPFLVVHVSIAFISSALFTLAFSVHVLQLVQDRRERAGRPPLMDRIPAASELERLGHRLVAISFPLWSFTLVAGAIWAEKAWGRYWGWDPKEVWTFVIWVVYAAYLHARATRGWDGRRSSWVAIAGFVCVLINFGVVNVFFTGQHSYAGIG